EVLGGVVTHVDELVAVAGHGLFDGLVAQRMRLGKIAPAQRMRVDDLLEVRGDPQGLYLLGLHVVGAVGDKAELCLRAEVREGPGGILEERQLRLMRAVGFDEGCEMLGRVARVLGGEGSAEKLTEVTVVEQERHVGGETSNAEFRFGPSSGCGKPGQSEL